MLQLCSCKKGGSYSFLCVLCLVSSVGWDCLLLCIGTALSTVGSHKTNRNNCVEQCRTRSLPRLLCIIRPHKPQYVTCIYLQTYLEASLQTTSSFDCLFTVARVFFIHTSSVLNRGPHPAKLPLTSRGVVYLRPCCRIRPTAGSWSIRQPPSSGRSPAEQAIYGILSLLLVLRHVSRSHTVSPMGPITPCRQHSHAVTQRVKQMFIFS